MKKAIKIIMNAGTHIATKAFVPSGTLKGLGRSPSLTRNMHAEMKINA